MTYTEDQLKSLIAQEVLIVLERLEDTKQKDFWETLLTIKKEFGHEDSNLSSKNFNPS
jgi:hypothetical protein